MGRLGTVMMVAFVMVFSLGFNGEGFAAEQNFAGKTLTAYWVKWNDDYNKGITEAAAEFEKATGCKIDFVWAGDIELGLKLFTAVETKKLPDMAAIWAGEHVPVFNAMGVLQPVSDVVKELKTKYGDFYDSMFPMVTFKGENYAVPFFAIPDGLHVRTDILKEAGLSLPKTWDDVLNIAKKTTNPEKKIYGFGQGLSGGDFDAEKWFTTMLMSYGGSVLSADGKKVTLNSPAALKVLKWIKEGWDAKIFPPDCTQWDSSGNNKSWNSGQAVMIYNASSSLWAMRKTAPDLLAKSAMVAPIAGPAKTLQVLDEHCITIFKSSENKEAAKAFIKFLMEKERYSNIVMPIAEPVIKSFGDDPKWKDPLNRPFLEAMPYTRGLGFPGPTTPGICEAYNRRVLGDMMASMIVYKRSPEKVLQDTSKLLEAIFARWR
jgi:multiple sugar transport system substrate-binding protein